MKRIWVFLSLLVSLTLGAADRLVAAEALHYQASYNGVLSLFQQLPIADVWYQTEAVDGIDNLQRISLTVSSENFDMVERLYPFRYLLHSYVHDTRWQTLLFETVKTTKKKRKTRHKIGLFDAVSSRIQLYRSTHQQAMLDTKLLSAFVTGNDARQLVKTLKLKPKGKPLRDLSPWPVDQLTLLSLARQQVQSAEPIRSYAVSSGDELLDYRISLGKREVLQIGGRQVPAVKVKLEGYAALPAVVADSGKGFLQVDAHADEISTAQDPVRSYHHAPVYVWVSEDDQALPLRFENQHAIGRFVIELVALDSD